MLIPEKGLSDFETSKYFFMTTHFYYHIDNGNKIENMYEKNDSIEK
jgi:hypothetical protein